MKKFLCLCLVCLMSMGTVAWASEVDSGAVYCFTSQDFAEEELTGICITSLPEGGTLMLGRRMMEPGEILTARQAEKLTFRPSPTERDTTARMCYLPICGNQVRKTAQMTISIRGRKDKAPVAENSVMETYKNLPNEGKLKVSDPEGKPLAITLCRKPLRGTVELGQDGTFCYTPKKNKVGVDSFTFTAADPAGNVSREATVTIQILKPMDARQYQDTVGESCRFEAEWLKNTGLFVGETINGQACFYPEAPVTRGQFLAMAVKLLNVPAKAEDTMQVMGPQWLQPYVNAALRSGLTENVQEMEQLNAPITGAQAAVMLQNGLELPISQQALETLAPEDGPQWAESSLQVLGTYGIQLSGEQVLTRGEAAEVLYRVRELALDAPGTAVFRIQ